MHKTNNVPWREGERQHNTCKKVKRERKGQIRVDRKQGQSERWMDYIRSRRGNTGWLSEKHLDKQAANTPTPQQGVLLTIPILHLLREPESYLHTTADGAREENHTA